MDIAPKSRLLYSLRAERGDIFRLCGEAVDNALDASADNIRILIADDEIKFVDDGGGILLEHIPALFTYGEHVDQKGTKLGRFGVGIFIQAISAADAMEVRTVSADGHFLAKANWRSVIRDGFRIEDPTPLPVPVGAPTSTIIKLSALRRLKAFTAEKVIDDLAMRFYPAIAEGRTISVNDVQVPLLKDPPMTEMVEREFQFSDGRTATLRGGLLRKPSAINKVHLGFGHRILKPTSTLGCGSYSGLSNMFARVQLHGSRWALTAFKDGLFDEDQLDELEDAIEAALTDILKKCDTGSMEARVATIGQMMNDMLPPDIAARPHHTRKGAGSGGRGGGKSGGAVSSEKSDPGGPAKRSPKDRLLITWEGKNSENGVGWCEPGRINRVHLSPDNPKIRELFRHRDDRFVALALLINAVTLFEEGRDAANPEPEMKFVPFGVRVAQHLLRNDLTSFQAEAG